MNQPAQDGLPVAGVDAFDETARIAIAHLQPRLANLEESHIEATVALLWPYSSSTRQLSLLIAEKDILLRKSRGQVKVTFHDDCAREVARTHVGIGDTIKLSLDEAAWTRTGEEVSTPGKKVDWDIDISKRVKLEVQRNDSTITTINFVAPTLSSRTVNHPKNEIESPPTNGFINISRSSPASSRLSSMLASPKLFKTTIPDPFMNENGHASGRARKRTRFARQSGSWQLLDDDLEQDSAEDEKSVVPNPSEDVGATNQTYKGEITLSVPESHEERISTSFTSLPPLETSSSTSHQSKPEISSVDEVSGTRSKVTTDSVNERSAPIVMGPPPLPPPKTEPAVNLSSLQDDVQDAKTVTPILRPLPSPSLPLVSPLLDRSSLATGYFPDPMAYQSELDAISQSATSSQDLLGAETSSAFEGAANMNKNDTLFQDPSLYNTTGNPELTEGISIVSRAAEAIQPLSGLPDSQPLAEMLPDDVVAQNNGDGDTLLSALETGIDLDALQQHIEESAQQMDGILYDDWPEDDDLYGSSTPVEHSTILPAKSPSSVIRIAQEEISTLTEPIFSPVQADLTQLSDVNTSAGNVIVQGKASPSLNQQAVTSTNLELRQSDIINDRSEAGTSPTRDLVEQYLASSPPPTRAGLPTNQALQNSWGESQLDGVFEQRGANERDAPLVGVETRPPQDMSQLRPIELLSDSSESVSPDVDNDHVEHGYSTAMHTEVISTVESNEAVDKELDLVENIARDTEKHMTNAGPISAEATVVNIEQEQAKAEPDRGHQVSTITPDATQETLSKDLALPFPNEFQQAFPPTPVPTQDRNDGDRQSVLSSTVRDTITEGHVQTFAPTIPEQPADVGKHRQVSRRLPRKQPPSEIITNEYFTPRRSARINQSSPLSTPTTPNPVSEGLTSPKTFKNIPPLQTSTSDQELQADQPLSSAHARGTTTILSYFPDLSTLSEHFNQKVDVMALCSADSALPQRAASGPRDHHTTLHLADPSFGRDNTTITAQIFRPRKNALPSAKRGDVVLLRNMKVQAQNHKMMLMSADSSAWAVFKQIPNGSFDVIMTGPPVEYDDSETLKAEQLVKWWQLIGGEKYSDMHVVETTQKDGAREVRSTSPMVTRSQRRRANTASKSTSADRGEGNQSIDDAVSNLQRSIEADSQLSSPVATASTAQFSDTDPSSPTTRLKRSRHRSTVSRRSESVVYDAGGERGGSVIHELRDGLTYIDE